MNRKQIGVRRAVVALFFAGGLALAILGRPSIPQAAGANNEELARFMRKKLDASSQILEGLTTKDSALIRKGTATLLQMSKAELWNVLADADYRDFSGEFRSSLKKLDEAAAKDNFDNALLQWFDSMKGCVECHKYVRDQRPVLKKD